MHISITSTRCLALLPDKVPMRFKDTSKDTMDIGEELGQIASKANKRARIGVQPQPRRSSETEL